jgi:hypothetical protein
MRSTSWSKRAHFFRQRKGRSLRKLDQLGAACSERRGQGTDARTDHFSSTQVLGPSNPGSSLVSGRASAP